jgi:hypothetical protein
VTLSIAVAVALDMIALTVGSAVFGPVVIPQAEVTVALSVPQFQPD